MMKARQRTYTEQAELIEAQEVQIETLREQLEAATRPVDDEFAFSPELGAIERFAERWATYARATDDPRGVTAYIVLRALAASLWKDDVDGADEFVRAARGVLRKNSVTDVDEFETAKKHLFAPIVTSMVKHIATAYEKHDPTSREAKRSGTVDLLRAAKPCATSFVAFAKKHPGMLPRFAEATTPGATRELVTELAEHLKNKHPRPRRPGTDARARVTPHEAAMSWTREALKWGSPTGLMERRTPSRSPRAA
jgi:hypothetical protein